MVWLTLELPLYDTLTEHSINTPDKAMSPLSLVYVHLNVCMFLRPLIVEVGMPGSNGIK